MFKWILRLLALLILAGLGLFFWGRTLPEHHVASVSARYARAPADVWNVLADPQRFPEWRPDVKSVELLPDAQGRAAWREQGDYGELALVRAEADPPRRMVLEIVADPGAEPDFSGRWIFELVPDGSGTRVTITEDGRIHNPLFRSVASLIAGYQSTATAYLRALGTRFNETVEPVPGEVTFPG
jgi:uncharacterized protein YndB with AHSA1/START domain